MDKPLLLKSSTAAAACSKTVFGKMEGPALKLCIMLLFVIEGANYIMGSVF
jgi:hypothetical protein